MEEKVYSHKQISENYFISNKSILSVLEGLASRNLRYTFEYTV